jgi:hypothetical protein
VTRQRVFERGDGESSSQHGDAEEDGPDPTAFGAASDQIADHTDDRG